MCGHTDYCVLQMASSASGNCGLSASNPNYGDAVDDHSRAAKFKLSPEEVNVLKECNQESFFYRCLPLSTIGMVGAHFAVQSGYLKGSAKYGSLWKVLGFGALGYFAGKFSYRSKCEEKIMRLPNSQLAEVIRRRSKGGASFSEIYNDPSYSGVEGSGRGGSATIHSTPMEYAQGTWEIDSEKNVEYQGMDDSNRPNVDDSSMSTPEDRPNRGPSVSYDSLRQRNREEYEVKRAVPYRPDRSTNIPDRQEPIKRVATNKYGDTID